MNKKNIIKIGQVTLNTDDTEDFPTVQAFFNGKPADVFLVQPYGLTSRPPQDSSMVALLSQQGNEGARMGIQFCPSFRSRGLKSGEVVLENMLAGSFYYLKSDGDLVINIPKNISETCKNITINAEDVNATFLNVTINATKITLNSEIVINGKTTINGDIATTGLLTNNDIDISSTHTHGGVTVGGGNSAVPN